VIQRAQAQLLADAEPDVAPAFAAVGLVMAVHKDAAVLPEGLDAATRATLTAGIDTTRGGVITDSATGGLYRALGAPVTTSATFADAALRRLTADHAELLTPISTMGTVFPQEALRLVQLVAVRQHAHLLALLPPETAAAALGQADDAAAAAVLDMLGRPAGAAGAEWSTPAVLAQLALPTALGGAGATRLLLQADEAHVASRANVLPLLLHRYAGASDEFAELREELEDLEDSELPWAVALRAAYERTEERVLAHADMEEADITLLGRLERTRATVTEAAVDAAPEARDARAAAWTPTPVELPALAEFCDSADEPGKSPHRGLRWGLTHAAGLRAFLDLWHGSDDIDKARLGAVAMQGGCGAFLARTASGDGLLHLAAAEQQVATRRVLGLPEPRCWLNRQCPGCGQDLTSDREAALHYPCCPGPMTLGVAGGGDLYGTQLTHTALKKVVGRIITEAGYLVMEEVPGLFGDEQAERPGDCTVLGFHDGHRHLAVDVNCTRIMTNTHLLAASSAPGTAQELTEGRKVGRYAELLARAGGTIAFVPFVSDEFGGVGDYGQQLLQVLAQRATAGQEGARARGGTTTGAEQAALLERWRQAIAVAVHRTQARVILAMTARAGRNGAGV
jgi:hypothetical protein